MTTRRSFLHALGLGAAGLALDPERLLWVPGKKLISIPKPAPLNTVWLGGYMGTIPKFNVVYGIYAELTYTGGNWTGTNYQEGRPDGLIILDSAKPHLLPDNRLYPPR